MQNKKSTKGSKKVQRTYYTSIGLSFSLQLCRQAFPPIPGNFQELGSSQVGNYLWHAGIAPAVTPVQSLVGLFEVMGVHLIWSMQLQAQDMAPHEHVMGLNGRSLPIPSSHET